MKNFIKISFIYFFIFACVFILISISLFLLITNIENTDTNITIISQIIIPAFIILFSFIMLRRSNLDTKNKKYFQILSSQRMERILFLMSYWGMGHIAFLIKDRKGNFLLKQTQEETLYENLNSFIRLNQLNEKEQQIFINELFTINYINTSKDEKLKYLFFIDLEKNILIDPDNKLIHLITSQHEIFNLIMKNNSFLPGFFLSLKSIIIPKSILIKNIGWKELPEKINKSFHNKIIQQNNKALIEIMNHYQDNKKEDNHLITPLIKSLMKHNINSTVQTKNSADLNTTLNCLYYNKNKIEKNEIKKGLKINNILTRRPVL